MSNVNVAIVGNGGVGKTSFKRKLLFNIFLYKYDPNMSEIVYTYTTDKAKYILTDTCGQKQYESRFAGYDCVLVMFDSVLSYKNVNKWTSRIIGGARVILVRNKYDIVNHKLDALVARNIHDLPIVNISIKKSDNIEAVLDLVYEKVGSFKRSHL